MAGGKFSRLKTWVAKEILLYSDLNAEFDNVIQNFQPDKIDSWSNSASQEQIQTDPGSTGSLTTVTSLSDEIERLRFVISRIIGKTYWYDTPSKSLQTASFNSLAFYLPFDGGSTTDTLQSTIQRGGIPNALTNSVQSLNAADFSSSVVKFGNFSYSLGAGKVLAASGSASQRQKGTLSAWFNSLNAGDYIAYNPQQGIEVYLDGTGKLNAKITKSTSGTANVKDTSLVTGSANRSGDPAWAHVTTKWAMNGISGAATDQLSLRYGKTSSSDEGTQISAASIPTNIGDGGAWFLGSKRNDPAWTSFLSFHGLPVNDDVGHWAAASVTGGSASAPGTGILTFTCTSNQKASISSQTVSPSLTNFTIEVKLKVVSSSSADTGIASYPVGVRVADGANSFNMSFNKNGMSVTNAQTSSTQFRNFMIDTGDWHVYRVTVSGGTALNAYIDGVHVGSITLIADTTTTAGIMFGHVNNAVNRAAVSQWEWLAYSNVTATAPIAAGAGGYLDDVAVVADIIDSATENSFFVSPVSSVIGADKPYHRFWHYQLPFRPSAVGNVKTSNIDDFTSTADTWYLVSDGVTPVSIFGASVVGNNTLSSYAAIALDVDSELVNCSTLNASVQTAFLTDAFVGTAVELMPVAMSGKRVFPVGVRTVKLGVGTSSGGTLATVYTSYSTFTPTYERLG